MSQVTHKALSSAMGAVVVGKMAKRIAHFGVESYVAQNHGLTPSPAEIVAFNFITPRSETSRLMNSAKSQRSKKNSIEMALVSFYN